MFKWGMGHNGFGCKLFLTCFCEMGCLHFALLPKISFMVLASVSTVLMLSSFSWLVLIVYVAFVAAALSSIFLKVKERVRSIVGFDWLGI